MFMSQVQTPTVYQSMWREWQCFKKIKEKVNDPKMTFDPTPVEITSVITTQGPKSHENISTIFNQKVNDPNDP